LNAGRDKEEAYHNEFENYSDEGCAWIESDNAFSSWASDSTDPGVLLMLGDVGCGKTITTVHVVKLLHEKHPIVCCYFCRDDHSTTDLGNIYRSLLWQLLRQKPDLKYGFYQWHNNSNSPIEPGRSQKQLREFLSVSILSSATRIFLVLDSLDECEGKNRNHLLELIQELLQKGARLKVFLTSRYGHEPTSILWHNTTKVELRPSMQRDQAIAKYLVAKSSLPTELHETAAREIAARAEGSAIWLRIASEYIQKTHAITTAGLHEALKRLPSSAAGLAELYFKLFERACEGLAENYTLLQAALETLAVSRRPLSLDELVCALTLGMEDTGVIATISDLEREAPAVDVLNFVRPFVSTAELRVGGSTVLRLVHQSLRELILWGPPESWHSIGRRRPGRQLQQRNERLTELNTRLLRSCIKYLLLNDCEEMKLVAGIRDQDDDDGLMHLGADIFDDSDSQRSIHGNTRSDRYFDPAELGLGHFFAYAASFWTSHFSDVTDELRPHAADLLTLCRPGSQRLSNWVYQWHRPNGTQTSESPEVVHAVDLDPLVVTAMFGPAASLVDLMLTCHLRPPEFVLDSVWKALRELNGRNEVKVILEFVKHDQIGPILRHPAVFEHLTGGVDWRARDTPDWQEVFCVLTKALREELLKSGNKILCLAARRGCLVLVKQLFEAADQDSVLKSAILCIDMKGKGTGNSQVGLDQHQSIGQAAWESHAEVVRFLCEQDGTQHHLHYVNHAGHTVFHQWARRHDPEVFGILYRHWPEGMRLKDNGDDGPIIEAMWQFSGPEEELIGLLRVLRAESGIDLSGKHDRPSMTPLLVAARLAKVEVSRFLITECSADIYSLLGVDPETSTPFLRVSVSLPGDQGLHGEEELRRELCSLLPLALLASSLV